MLVVTLYRHGMWQMCWGHCETSACTWYRQSHNIAMSTAFLLHICSRPDLSNYTVQRVELIIIGAVHSSVNRDSCSTPDAIDVQSVTNIQQLRLFLARTFRVCQCVCVQVCVCVPFVSSAVNMTLPAFAAVCLLSIDISCPQRAQQQTHPTTSCHSCCRMTGQTDKHTDARPFCRRFSSYCVGSVSNVWLTCWVNGSWFSDLFIVYWVHCCAASLYASTVIDSSAFTAEYRDAQWSLLITGTSAGHWDINKSSLKTS